MAPDRRAVVVYYANEASQQALQSENYRTLLELLRSAATPEAAKLASDILEDAREFPQLVRRDVSALARAAADYRFDLVAFTNAWALEGRFLFRELATGITAQRPLQSLPAARHPALAVSPLSRPDFLRMALAEVAALFPSEALDIVLILNSHGSEEIILMPRVSTDLSRPDAAQAFLAALRGDGGRARTPGPHRNGRRSRAPASCSSGMCCRSSAGSTTSVFRWSFSRPARAVPRRCGKWPRFRKACAPSPIPDGANIKPIAIDYAELLRDGKSPLADDLASALQKRNVTVSTALTLWAWAAVAHAASIPLLLYLLPLGLWLAAYGSLLLLRYRRFERIASRNRSSGSAAMRLEG